MICIYCIEPEIALGHIEIAFMGYNAKLTREYFREFVEDNKDQIIEATFNAVKYIAEFKNGTIVRVLSAVDSNRGYKIDQILLVDDERKMIYRKRADDIHYIQEYCMGMSCVPKEFRIMFMNIDCLRGNQIRR